MEEEFDYTEVTIKLMDEYTDKPQLPKHIVSISSLIEKADAENIKNRRKMFDNLTKPTKDIEPYDNTHFLNMVNAVSEALN